jgi:preprotein translocase subunit SecD
MAMTKIQVGTIAAILLAGITTFFVQHESLRRLRDENEVMRQQTDQLAMLQTENERLSNAAAVAAANSRVLAKEQLSELLKLRAELGSLRQRQRELAGSATKANSARPSQLESSATPVPFQLNLVLDDADEEAQVLTNNASLANGKTPPEVLRVGKSPLMDYTAVSSASVITDSVAGLQIEIVFTDEGRERFAAITRENLNKRVAIAIDGQLYSAPIIRSEITGGKAMVSGSFTDAQAHELAGKINEALGHR